ncbi:hypothetical protein LENED_004735 [Lentinula edodes]|uniref:Uncharacterized protein n=1 Tax=Lentinula edodes TaxID=5353 RepID=A0A1Q3E795_LENED|nr:hypothetical protein LENED_004735 [Lentinula edodes]
MPQKAFNLALHMPSSHGIPMNSSIPMAKRDTRDEPDVDVFGLFGWDARPFPLTMRRLISGIHLSNLLTTTGDANATDNRLTPSAIKKAKRSASGIFFDQQKKELWWEFGVKQDDTLPTISTRLGFIVLPDVNSEYRIEFERNFFLFFCFAFHFDCRISEHRLYYHNCYCNECRLFWDNQIASVTGNHRRPSYRSNPHSTTAAAKKVRCENATRRTPHAFRENAWRNGSSVTGRFHDTKPSSV